MFSQFLRKMGNTLNVSIFFSVFTNQTDNWCYLGRTMVTFDSVAGKWNCPRRGTGRSHRCIHRMMGMWWIFQESPGTLVANSGIQVDDIDDLESDMLESSITCESEHLNAQKICAITDYLKTNKRMPCLQDLPVHLRLKRKSHHLLLNRLRKSVPTVQAPPLQCSIQLK